MYKIKIKLKKANILTNKFRGYKNLSSYFVNLFKRK